jgi:hypothetical protein
MEASSQIREGKLKTLPKSSIRLVKNIKAASDNPDDSQGEFHTEYVKYGT